MLNKQNISQLVHDGGQHLCLNAARSDLGFGCAAALIVCWEVSIH